MRFTFFAYCCVLKNSILVTVLHFFPCKLVISWMHLITDPLKKKNVFPLTVTCGWKHRLCYFTSKNNSPTLEILCKKMYLHIILKTLTNSMYVQGFFNFPLVIQAKNALLNKHFFVLGSCTSHAWDLQAVQNCPIMHEPCGKVRFIMQPSQP